MATVEKRGNSYRITVSNGYDITGKQIREKATFTPDPNLTPRQQKKSLDKYVFDFEEKVRNGKFLKGEKITVQEFSERWLKEYALQQLEASTIEKYKHELNNKIIPALGHLKIAKLQPLHLQSFYNNLLESGVRKDKKTGGYSPSSIKKTHAVLSVLLKTAVQWQVIESNVCERVSPPKIRKEIDGVKFFTPEQCVIFLEALNKDYMTEYKAHDRIDDTGIKYHVRDYKESHSLATQHKIFFNIALFGGLRKGELLALTWDDINFENNTIRVSKAVSVVNGQHIIKQPKNNTSNRIVTLPDTVMKLIKRLKMEQNEKKLSLGDYWEDSGYLFTQENGKLMNYSTPYHTFKDLIVKYNNSILNDDSIPDDSKDGLLLPNIPLHGLRHTSATLLISEQVDIRTVSARLGHAQTSTTMNIYAHSLKESDKKASDKLENLFQKKA